MNNSYYNWADKFQLLNPEKNTPTENAILVTLEYELLYQKTSFYTVSKINKYFLTNTKGLYTQTHYGKKADHGDVGLEPNSHDNITAMIVAFKLANMKSQVNEMWSYMKRNLFTYDFNSPNKVSFKRILHPRDIIFYGYLAKNPICMLLLPLLFGMMYFSCKKPREITSGKLLWWVRLKCLPKIFTTQFNKMVDIEDAFRVYYHQDGHPIKELL